MQASSHWRDTFSRFFHSAVEKYRAGHQKAAGLLDSSAVEFLASIGYTEQEFFDFAEDFARGGEPTLETALDIADVRRAYFMQEQKGTRTGRTIETATLPAKDAETDGIGWLPRLLAKAEAKLRGEMPPDLMYGCGGDRKFFRAQRIDPAEFLRQVWQAQGDHRAVVDWVKKNEPR